MDKMRQNNRASNQKILNLQLIPSAGYVNIILRSQHSILVCSFCSTRAHELPGGLLSISGQIDFTCIANSDIELPPLLCQRCYRNQCAALKFLTSSFERGYLFIDIYFGMVFREYKLLPYQQPWRVLRVLK